MRDFIHSINLIALAPPTPKEKKKQVFLLVLFLPIVLLINYLLSIIYYLLFILARVDSEIHASADSYIFELLEIAMIVILYPDGYPTSNMCYYYIF